jgi:predicted RNase H-like nuclease
VGVLAGSAACGMARLREAPGDAVGLPGPAVVGLDGCRAGWVAAWWPLGDGPPVVEVVGPDALAQVLDRAVRAFIDMPIGLPGPLAAGEGGAAPGRATDALARAALGWPRASSVFPAPARATLDAPDHAAANAAQRAALGVGLPVQAYHLLPRVRSLDTALRSAPLRSEATFEAHPELAFAWLAGGPIGAGKRTAAGAAARDHALAPFVDAEGAVRAVRARWPRAVVADDDVRDALALAVLARASWPGPVPVRPTPPPCDAVGLRMAMVWPDDLPSPSRAA